MAVRGCVQTKNGRNLTAMIPLIGLLLCVYLAFKGLEIFQIAHSNPDAPASSIVIGVAALLSGIVIGAIFAALFLASSTVPMMPLR